MFRQIIALFVLLVLLVSGVLFYLQDKQQNSAPNTDSANLLDIANKAFDFSTLQSIQISKENNVLLNAQLLDGTWFDFQFDAKTGFPMDSAQLIALSRQLQTADVIEFKSADPQNHAILGLANNTETLSELSDEKSASTIISMIGNKEINLLVGKTAKIQEGQFVRFESENQTYLVDQIFKLPENPYAWLKDDLLNIDRQQIQEISAFKGDRLIWQIRQQSNDSDIESKNSADIILPISTRFELVGQSEGETLAFENVLVNYISTLEELRLTSLTYSPTNETMMQSASMRLMLKLKRDASSLNNTNLIQLALFSEDGKYFVHMLGAGEREYLNNWRFEVPSYVGEGLVKTRSNFVKQNVTD